MNIKERLEVLKNKVKDAEIIEHTIVNLNKFREDSRICKTLITGGSIILYSDFSKEDLVLFYDILDRSIRRWEQKLKDSLNTGEDNE